MQAIYSKNSLGSFFDIKDFVMGVCLSTVTTFVQQPFPISRNKKDEDLSEIKYFNNSNSKNIDKVIEMMLGEDAEMIADFLGYKPDDEVLNNNQLLEEELEIVARQMPDDILIKFYEKSQEKSRRESEKNYCLQAIENLLTDMEDYKSKLQYKDKMESIIEVIDTAITNIEALKSDME